MANVDWTKPIEVRYREDEWKPARFLGEIYERNHSMMVVAIPYSGNEHLQTFSPRNNKSIKGYEVRNTPVKMEKTCIYLVLYSDGEVGTPWDDRQDAQDEFDEDTDLYAEKLSSRYPVEIRTIEWEIEE
jgi:hypothetical protein